MFFGVHLLLYSRDPEADRAFFREVLGLSTVDAGHGWLIFALPPSEAAIHPSDAPPSSKLGDEDLAAGTLYLMCGNLQKTLEVLKAKQVQHTAIHQERWGTVTSIRLPGGGQLGLYEPRHPLAIPPPAGEDGNRSSAASR